MTESEAKTKWCPLSRVVVVETDSSFPDIVASTNRGICFNPRDNNAVKEHTSCIASACMFWRENERAVPASARYCATEAQGFCGAAGRPWTY